MHGKRLRDIFPAIPERIDHWLFSQLLARPATAGKACALEHCYCSMLTAPLTDRRLTVERYWNCRPSNLAAGLHVRTAARNGPLVEAVRAVSRTAHSIIAMLQSRSNTGRTWRPDAHEQPWTVYFGSYNEARDLNWSHVRRDGPLTWSAFASHCRPSHPALQSGPGSSTSVCICGPLVTVRGRLVHGHPLPQGSAEYTVG
ncbi:hypothetical protein QBC32DRAFT_30385 [Pseudoneurospora amorphoporcata]|uniref:Uncharacterized protein n=1 Tax=Pseudoneurospora amorphoporcata TaxID=241081 RepID=A0AAN6SE86_9PEZI|nr:hypothetical protein QBC32DRAFT_30385 [Pseudoneurospora amorphoporcata]